MWGGGTAGGPARVAKAFPKRTRQTYYVDSGAHDVAALPLLEMEVEGFGEKIGPISGLSGKLVLWLVTAQWTYHMVQRNETPFFWQNYLEAGAVDYDNLTHAKFLERGY